MARPGSAAGRGPAFAVLLAAVAGLLAGAGPSRADTPAAGQALFVEKCAMCHRAGGMGSGLLSRRHPKGQELLESRTALSAGLVRTVVRHGLGNMPPLSRAEVSDVQLERIVAYLAKGTP